MRVGGNAVDISKYDSSQTQFLNITDPNAQQDHIPVTFGPTLLNVIGKVGKDIGGAEYILGMFWSHPSTSSDLLGKPGLSLSNPDDPTVADLAVAAHQILGDGLDVLLLGNVGILGKCPVQLLTELGTRNQICIP